MTEPLLRADAVRKSFGRTKALDGASMAVRAGEIVAVMGPSGSGKSTLLHCLAGIIAPDAGTVTYAGQDLGAMPDVPRSALRRTEFGFVFQFGQLVPELTCVENVALPLRLGGRRRRDAEGVAREWLARLEVGDVAAKRPGEVSGGQGQRVAVARALVTGPKVIFAEVALPIALGVLVAVLTGVGPAWLIVRLAGEAMAVDWAGVGYLSGAAALLALVVTALTLPFLRGATRLTSLRTG